MKTRKLLKRLQSLLDSELRAQEKQQEAIKSVLDDLREKEQHFRAKLEAAEDDEHREKYQRKIAVCHAQRSKGLEVLRELQGRD